MINRHNYEEFFLMYVDNELTVEQRAEVELFVQQNPDLQKEFEMLLQTKLSTDEKIAFGHKTDLLKIKDSIGIDNYQEYFLLYIDNELNKDSREAVEKFVLQHPELQDEFTLLKQTVLPQEKIGFPNKKSLYRREERRVIPFAWMRVAAAAALLGAAVLVWWMKSGDNNNNTSPVVTVQPDKQTVKPSQDQQQNKTTQPANPAQQNNQVAETQKVQEKKENKETIAKTKKKNNKKRIEETKQNVSDNNISDNLASNNKKDNNINKLQQQIQEKKENNVATTQPVIAQVTPEKDSQTEDPLEKAKSTSAMQNHDPDIIKPAVYKELDTDDDENRNALYIGNMEVNKNKVRGFMKKVGGLFAGKSKGSSNEKGKLQVANFELNTN